MSYAHFGIKRSYLLWLNVQMQKCVASFGTQYIYMYIKFSCK